MIIIAKAADVLIQPRVLKVARKIQKLGYECKVVGIGSNKRYFKNKGMKNIVNVNAQLSNPFIKVDIFRRFVKLVKFIRVLCNRKVDRYLVHDNLSLAIVCVIKLLYRDVQIIYIGDELEIDRGFRWIKKYFIEILMRYGAKKCNYLFQADFNRKVVFEKFTKRSDIQLLRNVPECVFSFSPINIKKELFLAEDCLIFIYTGLISKHRGIETTLDALCMLSNHVPCCYLLIGWGEDQYLRHIGDLINKKEARFVNFKGYFKEPMPVSELLNWTHSSDIGLSLIENFSMSYYLCTPSKVYEYMMAGIPFIASDFPENRCLVEDTQAGVLANPESANDIYLTLKKMTSDKINMKQMGKRGRTAALDRYNWEKESEILDKILQ